MRSLIINKYPDLTLFLLGEAPFGVKFQRCKKDTARIFGIKVINTGELELLQKNNTSQLLCGFT